MNRSVSVVGSWYAQSRFCWYMAVMAHLPANTRVYYRAGNSSTFSFWHQPERAGGRVWAVYGDFGLRNDVSMDALLAEAATGAFDGVMHAGDWAYDFNSNNGQVGNDFMNTLQPVAAIVPYMGAVGNHESDGRTFAGYRTRLAGYGIAANNSGSNTMLWYSFNDGVAHWVCVNTELWFYGGTEAEISDQFRWLEADLAAVDRAVTPWVIGVGHKHRWMDSSNFTALERVLANGGTNLYFCGHQHNYQRLYPTLGTTVQKSCVSGVNDSVYVNCGLPIPIVVGSPGCREYISTGTAANRYLVAAVFDYGYGTLRVVNRTHLYWEWKLTPVNSTVAYVQDVAWFIKNDTIPAGWSPTPSATLTPSASPSTSASSTQSSGVSPSTATSPLHTASASAHPASVSPSAPFTPPASSSGSLASSPSPSPTQLGTVAPSISEDNAAPSRSPTAFATVAPSISGEIVSSSASMTPSLVGVTSSPSSTAASAPAAAEVQELYVDITSSMQLRTQSVSLAGISNSFLTSTSMATVCVLRHVAARVLAVPLKDVLVVASSAAGDAALEALLRAVPQSCAGIDADLTSIGIRGRRRLQTVGNANSSAESLPSACPATHSGHVPPQNLSAANVSLLSVRFATRGAIDRYAAVTANALAATAAIQSYMQREPVASLAAAPVLEILTALDRAANITCVFPADPLQICTAASSLLSQSGGNYSPTLLSVAHSTGIALAVTAVCATVCVALCYVFRRPRRSGLFAGSTPSKAQKQLVADDPRATVVTANPMGLLQSKGNNKPA